MNTLRDILGQEFVVGCKVVQVGGKTQYAGVVIREVAKVTEKSVGIAMDPNSSPGKLSYFHPTTCLVVDKLLSE